MSTNEKGAPSGASERDCGCPGKSGKKLQATLPTETGANAAGDLMQTPAVSRKPADDVTTADIVVVAAILLLGYAFCKILLLGG